MRLTGSDPDVATIVARIRRGDIILQPNFQRGEVWGDAKKRRLIDSILREWHVPPIHVIQVKETATLEVLDGQQRLVAIRDFANNALCVDGRTEPFDPDIDELDGKTYTELPVTWRRRFDQFTIRVFMITDYQPGEPGELFYRLNQPTNLTAAEQRNAFFGPARQQVKDLVSQFESRGLAKESIGFSNSRMAYDDVLSKLCLTIDNGSLREKVTAGNVTSKYRSQESFKSETVSRVEAAIGRFSLARQSVFQPVKFNKATLYSWLCFVYELETQLVNVTPEEFGHFVAEFERQRSKPSALHPPFSYLLEVFNDRASSRVSDVSSVLLRDLVLWVFFAHFLFERGLRLEPRSPQVQELLSFAHEVGRSRGEAEAQELLDVFIEVSQWGTQI